MMTVNIYSFTNKMKMIRARSHFGLQTTRAQTHDEISDTTTRVFTYINKVSTI